MSTTETAPVRGVEERPPGFWDGTEHAYIPPAELTVPDGLKLQRDYDDDIDPITYEVVRHGLWNANAEHVRVVENLAVSQITVEVRDFQPCILTEDAELLYFGPCLQYMAGMLDVMTSYVIEHRGERVADGDMWLCNDPIVGTAHQSDVGLMCPVFVDGELFCWVANIAHQNDIGGTVPGSFCPNAPDTFWEPPSYPPFKIVENGKVVEDMEALYRRCSRTPENLSLDLRATIAGNNTARDRILALVDKYGARVVKGVMRRALDASQRALEAALDTIPDGTYSERLMQEVAMTGDRGAYPVQATVRKRGRELVFDNEGTNDQVGAINIGFASWRGAILGAINVLMLPEQMGCVGGAARNCAFEPVPGTITAPDWGAAVSPAGLYGTHVGISLGNALVSKMMLASSDERLRDRALSTDAASWGAHILAGTNQRGDYYIAGMGESMMGGTGAGWRRDGRFSDGRFWIPDGRGPNIERYENDWPILYLYRREHAGSGGAGRQRAGNGGELAFVAHKGETAVAVYTAETVPKAMGLFGGGPGSICRSHVLLGTDVAEQFAAGRVPQELDEIAGERAPIVPKGDAIAVGDGDVMYWNWVVPGGYGDPLTREPELVAADVASAAVTDEQADRDYGVVLAADGSADVAATAAERERRFSERLRAGGVDAAPAAAVASEPAAETIGDVYAVDRAAGSVACNRCRTTLGPLDDPKREAIAAEREIGELGLDWPELAVDDELRWREHYCPGCGVRLATEVVRPGEASLTEFRLDP